MFLQVFLQHLMKTQTDFLANPISVIERQRFSDDCCSIIPDTLHTLFNFLVYSIV